MFSFKQTNVYNINICLINFESLKNKFETEDKNTMKMVKGDVGIMVMNGGES